jgi:hypothetical protein
VCLCSLVLHNSVFYGIDTSEHEETLPLAEARGEPDSSDSHTHELDDNMTSLDNITPHILVGLASRLQGAHLSTLSHTPNLFLPPPKSK